MEETDGCRVHILQGEGEISTIKPDPNTNLICTKTLIPVAVYHIKKGKNVLETEFYYVQDSDIDQGKEQREF